MTANAQRLNRLRSSARAASVAGASAVLLAGVWAVWPLGKTGDAGRPESPADVGEPRTTPLLAAVFEASLWPDAPAEPAAEASSTASQAPSPAPTPPAPLDVQLLGISADMNATGERVLRAALYERATGRVLVVSHGETINGRFVAEVGVDHVRLTLGEHAQVLALRPGGRP